MILSAEAQANATKIISHSEKLRAEHLQNMSAESLLILGNILSGSRVTRTTDSEVVYSNDVFFALRPKDEQPLLWRLIRLFAALLPRSF